MTDDLIEYEAKSTLYIQGIGELKAGQVFRAPATWVEVLRYVAKPLPPGRDTGGGEVEASPPTSSGSGQVSRFAKRRR